MNDSPSNRNGLALVVVIASGAAALAYQVIWDRLLRLTFGGDELGAVLVTSCFLLGLGLGARIFGRQFARPLRTYALVELGIGLFGLCSYPLLGGLSSTLARLAQPALADAEGLRLASALGVAIFLCLPCVLMGGTLPLVFACFVAPVPEGTRRVGLLYGANTVGAVLGVTLPLLLLSALRVPVALAAIAAINLAIAILASLASRGHEAVPRVDTPASSAPPPRLLAASFASGSLVLGWELVVLRHLGLIHPGSPYNFALVLVVCLAGLALGSVLFARGSRAAARVPVLFAGSAAAIGLSLAVSGAFLAAAGIDAMGVVIAERGVAPILGYLTLLALPFACVQGGVFPALLTRSPTASALPITTGPLYLASAVGSFVAGIALYAVGWDRLGARGVSCALVALAALMALWLAGELEPGPRRAARALALLAVVGISLVPSSRWRVLALGWHGRAPADQLSAVEGRSGTASVLWDAERARGEVRIGGKSFGLLPETPAWARAAAFARAQPVRARVLLIGLGSGTVLRALVEDPGVAHVDVVDWSAELPRLLREPTLREMTGWALDSPKVRLVRTDARTAVTLAAAASYDLVFESLTGYGPVGSTHYQSREYYRAVRRILAPGGLLLVVGMTLDDRGVAAAARESFPAGSWLPPLYALWSDRAPLESARLREALGGRIDLGSTEELMKSVRDLGAADPVAPVRDDELFGEYARGPFGRPRR